MVQRATSALFRSFIGNKSITCFRTRINAEINVQGGPTIIKLQWLISIAFFGGDDHPDMILSVNSISAPFRGTQVVYPLGECEDAAPAVRPISVGSAIAKGVHLVSFLAPYLPKLLDLHAESR